MSGCASSVGLVRPVRPPSLYLDLVDVRRVVGGPSGRQVIPLTQTPTLLQNRAVSSGE